MSAKDKFLALIYFLFFAPILILSEIALLTKVGFLADSSSDNHLVATIDVLAEESWGLSSQTLSSGGLSSATIRTNVVVADARPVLIRDYLRKYRSPLVPYADLIFATSQKYGLDYRLLIAIAQQESNLCKKIPPGSHNCWGWGIHSRGTLKFSSYPEAIEEVARGLKEEYIDKGLTTPEEIMRKYTPLSDGSWAFGVRQFMQELE